MKKIILILLIGILLLPWVKVKLGVFEEKALSGVTIETPKPTFTLHDWFEGDFQKQFEEYKGEKVGFKNSLVRIYNQVNYSLFKKPKGTQIIGKNEYLFENTYIMEATGQNFLGDTIISDNIRSVRQIQDYLDKRNIFSFTVFGPGKGDFYREYIPDRLLKKQAEKRNYTCAIEQFQKQNIRYIDFNKWFLSLKDTSKYPLMPQYGIHWSFYGMAYCADSICKYIETEKNILLTKFRWQLEISDTARYTDNDLESLLNIIDHLPSKKFAYPKYYFEEPSGAVRPRLLVVGDSFYWTIFGEHIFDKVFSNETYYYYDSQIYPPERASSTCPHDLDMLKEVGKYDVVIFLQSQGNYHNPGLGFAQMMLRQMDKQKQYKERAIKLIASDKNLNEQAKQIALLKNITPDSAVSVMADSMASVHITEISKIKISMRGDKEWLTQLINKSSDKVSLEEVMQNDAEWLYDQNNP